MDIKDIVKHIKSGELTRDNDETGANGFWDYSYELTSSAENYMASDEYQDMTEGIYNNLWETYELTKERN